VYPPGGRRPRVPHTRSPEALQAPRRQARELHLMYSMTARPQRARWYRSRGPCVIRRAVCSPDSLQIVGEGQVWNAGSAPGCQSLSKGWNGVLRQRDDASHWITISLDDEGVSPRTDLAEDIVKRSGQLGGGNPMFHSCYDTESPTACKVLSGTDVEFGLPVGTARPLNASGGVSQ